MKKLLYILLLLLPATIFGQGKVALRGAAGSGSGSPNSNIGSGFRFAVPNTNNIKTYFGGWALGLDSTTNSNAITATVDSLRVASWGRIYKVRDSMIAASSYINQLKAATASNQIDNGNFSQWWEYNTLGATIGLRLSSTSTAAASNSQILLSAVLSGANSTSSQTTISGVFGNVHTGTSSTNIGVQSTASGGTTNIAAKLQVSGGTTNYVLVGNGGSFGLGTLTPVSSAVVEMSSSTQGFLPVRMTSSQRTGVSSPASGLHIVDMDSTYRPFIYNGSAWKGLAYTTDIPISGGTTTIGTINSQTASANGAVISGSSLYMQTVTTSVPGLMPDWLLDSLVKNSYLEVGNDPTNYVPLAWQKNDSTLYLKSLKVRGDSTLATDTTIEIIRKDVFILAASDETTAITTGTAKLTFRMPYAVSVLWVRASLSTASSSGTPTFDINENGTTILSTKITIDANEKTSATAATVPVISDASLADDSEITIDFDVAGTGATGVKITIYYVKV